MARGTEPLADGTRLSARQAWLAALTCIALAAVAGFALGLEVVAIAFAGGGFGIAARQVYDAIRGR